MFDKDTWKLILKEIILEGDSNESYDCIEYVSFDKEKCLKTLNIVQIPFEMGFQENRVLGYARTWEGATAAISLSEKIKEKHLNKVLFHELAHTQLHIKDLEFVMGLRKDGEPERYVTAVAEIEAECTAFLLISILGFEGSRGALQYIENFCKKFRYRNKFDSQIREETNLMVDRIISAAETILKAGLVQNA